MLKEKLNPNLLQQIKGKNFVESYIKTLQDGIL